MKISYQWLSDFLQGHGLEETEQTLTSVGLEVDGIEHYRNIEADLSQFVVGEVLSCEKHPNADKLKITTVNVGQNEPLPIVCGAPNVAKGQKVVVALVGSELITFKGEKISIKKAKIRGEISEGMICAQDEIGVGESHEGIMVLDPQTKVGTKLNEVINVYEDYVISVDLTANRGDAASHLGVARDLKVAFHQEIKLPEISETVFNDYENFKVKIHDAEACPRYTSAILKGMKNQESPQWIQNRLKALGLNPKNVVVDVTNYVLHELGQPIHAFDLHKIEGNEINVRYALENEKIVTLDQTEKELKGFELLICDQKNPLALAGVMGGAISGVTTNTSDVLIEVAYFNPAVIRKTAKYHGFQTDASFRYERGTDPNITKMALQRVVYLLQKYAGAELVNANDLYPNLIPHFSTNFRLKRLQQISGFPFQAAQVKKYLQDLEISVDDTNQDNWQLKIPPYRFDVRREIDVIEEVVRFHGLNNIPFTDKVQISFNSSKLTEEYLNIKKLKDFLVAKGFTECINNSLTQAKGNDEEIKMLNPLSKELGVLRTDMKTALLNNIAYNINRSNKSLKLFEIGNIYQKKNNEYNEKPRLALVTTGSIYHKLHWQNPKPEMADEFYLKGIILGIQDYIRSSFSFNIETIEPKELKSFKIKQKIHYTELDLTEVLQNINHKIKLEAIPKFPIVQKDIAVILPKQATFKEIEESIKKSAGKYFRECSVFDVFEGEPLKDEEKSYAINIELYDTEKTMADKQIEKLLKNIIQDIEKNLGYQLRK